MKFINDYNSFLILEKFSLKDNILTVYHRTKNSPRTLLEFGFIEGLFGSSTGLLYGPGIYTNYNLNDSLNSPNAVSGIYGDYIIKMYINIDNFVILNNYW